ncbi:MAG: hypothetical protein LBU03_04535 [Tannerellaceae bacterium]|nr:hypothetical protein [Tannerellaceae bacterium]
MERLLYFVASCFILSLTSIVRVQADIPYCEPPDSPYEDLTLFLLDEQRKQSSSLNFDEWINLEVEAIPFSLEHKGFIWHIEALDYRTHQCIETLEQTGNGIKRKTFMTASVKTIDSHHQTLKLHVFRANTIFKVKVVSRISEGSEKIESNVYELYVSPIYADGVVVSYSETGTDLFIAKNRDTTLQYHTTLDLQTAVRLPDKYNQANLTHYPEGVTDTLVHWYISPTDPLRPAVEMLSHPENARQVSFRAINSLAVDTVWVETYDHPTETHRDSFIIRTDTIHVEGISLQIINPKIDNKYALADTVRLRAVVTPANADYDSIVWTITPSGWIEVMRDVKNDSGHCYISLCVAGQHGSGKVTVTASPKGRYVSAGTTAKHADTTLTFLESSKASAPKWITSLKLSASVNGDPIVDGATIDPYVYVSMGIASQPNDATNPTGIFILSDLPDHLGLPVGILSASTFNVFANKPSTHARIIAFAIDSLLATNTVSLDDFLAPDISKNLRDILDKLPVKDTFSFDINYIPIADLSLRDKVGLVESTIQVGETIELTASILPVDATFRRLEWFVEQNTYTETVTFLDSDETRLTRSVKALLPGEVHICVKSLDKGLSAKYIFHVTGEVQANVVTGVIIKSDINEAFSVLSGGDSVKLLAHITPPTLPAALSPISWTVFPQTFAEIIRSGQPEAVDKPAWAEIKLVGQGTAVTIIATAENGVQGTYVISVPLDHPDDLLLHDELGRTFPILTENTRIELVALPQTVDSLEWEIENTAVVVFDDGKDGENTHRRTIKAIKPGAVTYVFVRTRGKNPVTASIQITVNHRPATGIFLRDPAGEITNRQTPLMIDELIHLTATLQGEPSFTEIGWTIDNPAIVAFADDKTYARTRTFKALSTGHTRVRVVTRDGSQKNSYYAVYVNEPSVEVPIPPLEEIPSVTPPSPEENSSHSDIDLLVPFENSSPRRCSVRYQDGQLLLNGLKDTHVHILTISGRHLAAFPVETSTYSRSIPLVPGVYILYPYSDFSVATFSPFLFVVN